MLNFRLQLAISHIHGLNSKSIDFVLALQQANIDIDIWMELPEVMIPVGDESNHCFYILKYNKNSSRWTISYIIQAQNVWLIVTSNCELVLQYTKQLHFMSVLVTIVKTINYGRRIRTSREYRINEKWPEKRVSPRNQSTRIIVF